MSEINRWELHRAGVLNFWYYDEEYFDFANGKLLLRGTNGSGKSVTMQSLLPVLLDGKKSPDRLDPFGSKARKMEDYLLGEKEIVNRDERTGYLFLEYKRTHSDQYITTGIGLRAKRNKNMEFWGFVLFDGRRIGKDFKLYKEEKAGQDEIQKIPFTKKELEHRISEGGVVVHTQKEYMELVNKYVFKFESLDAYEELIKLLIQLRSPKLSKDFKPTVIYEILEESLPALADEDLRHLSDTIENMDQSKQQLEQLKRDKGALERLGKTYSLYNDWLLAEKASYFVKEQRQSEKMTKRLREIKEQKQSLETQLIELKDKSDGLKREQSVIADEQEKLATHDVWKAEKEKEETLKQLQGIQRAIKDRDGQLSKKEQKERVITEELKKLDEQLYNETKKLKEQLERLDEESEEASFGQHQMNADDFDRHQNEKFDFTVWKREANDHWTRLNEILQDWQKHGQYKRQYEDLYKEYGELSRELDVLRYEEKKWQQTFEEEKSQLQDQVFEWNQAYPSLKIGDEALRLFSQRVNDVYESYSYEEAKSPISNDYQSTVSEFEKEKVQNKHEQQLKINEISQRQAELKVWKDKTDPEPVRNEQTDHTRKVLKEKEIAHLPFYAAVEFLDDVSEEMRERIESALEHAGILDALITEQNIDINSDRVIIPKPEMMAHTLADYLKPDPDESASLSVERIDEVLRSILIANDQHDQSESFISENGQYQLGIIQGHAPIKERANYIGRTARKRFRLEKIAELEAEIETLLGELHQLEEEEKAITVQIETAHKAYQDFPSDRDAQTAYRERERVKNKRENKEQEVQRKNTKLEEIYQYWQTIKRNLQQQTTGLELEFSMAAYQDAVKMMKSYMDQLNDLELIFTRFGNVKGLIKQYQEQLQEIQDEVDLLKGELTGFNDQQKQKELELEKVEQRLQEMGAEEIREQIEKVRKRLAEISEEYPQTIKNISDTENKVTIIEAEEQREKQRLTFSLELLRAWKESFLDEEQLSLASLLRNNEEIIESDDPLERAKHVIKQYGHLLREHDRNWHTDRLNKVFFQEQPNLVEYRMTEEKHQNDVAEMEVDFELTEEMELKVNEWKTRMTRTKIILEYKGQRVSPYFVLYEIQRDYELQKEYLNDQDRELYEEIILKSVGRILRSRIQRAEHWIKEMNILMEKRDTSSGLNFSIKWRPRTAETEEEMDTKELVDLLRMNANLLKAEDLQRVTNHFRSKIDRAREMMEERGQGDTLHQVMKEVLDYRKWFSFTLYYQRTGESKRELTNQIFFKFSGGEKAMAMYIPLFTAAYSRYQDAGKDAPYVISLDEAFAGVDENNIRDMFELVEELGFNYIMNSQALWGDYDTVSHLSICELVRPKNASFVTVIRYVWDGTSMNLHFNTEEEAEDVLV